LFDFEPKTIIIQIVNFFILLFFLNIFLFKPLKQAIKDREDKVRNTLDEAESINAEAEKLKEQYGQKLSQAKKEAQDIIQSAQDSAEKTKNEIIDDAKKEARYTTEKAVRDVEAMRAKEMDKVRAEAGNIAVNMAEKLLRESLDDKYQAALVQSFLDKTGGKQ